MDRKEAFNCVQEVWDNYGRVECHYLTTKEHNEIQQLLDEIEELIDDAMGGE